MTNYGGYLGLIGDIMSAKSAGGADELNAQLQIRKGIKNARQVRKDGAKSVNILMYFWFLAFRALSLYASALILLCTIMFCASSSTSPAQNCCC
jgi:hypothetical protein